MRLELTLQRRVAIGFSLFFVIVIVAFSTTVLWVSEYQEEQLIDHLVGQEMDYLVDQYRVYPQVAPPKTQNLYGYIIDTDKVDTNLPRELRQLRAGAHEIFVDGVELHVAVREFSGSKFYLIYDVSQHEQRIRQFRLEIYLAIAISVILA